jgi:hypothetical protein
MVEIESRKVTRLFLEYYQSSKMEDLQSGVDALEAHWREVRHSRVSKWIRYYILTWEADLFVKMGRLDDALAASTRARSLPASPYARIVNARTRAVILRGLDRPAEAFESAMAGLRRCARAKDVDSSQGLILEIARMGKDDYLEELAAKYGALVLGASRLPNQLKLLGPFAAETPIGVLKALRKAITAREQS